MKPIHSFATSRAVEDVHAEKLDQWLKATYPDMRPATRVEQFRGIDRVAMSEQGVVTLDYKCDTRGMSTGRMFLETVSNSVTKRPGWLLTSEADWLVYYVVPDEVWMFLFANIRGAIANWRQTYGERSARNEGYDTLGVCVPFSVAATRVEYVANIHVDGAVLELPDDGVSF